MGGDEAVNRFPSSYFVNFHRDALSVKKCFDIIHIAKILWNEQSG